MLKAEIKWNLLLPVLIDILDLIDLLLDALAGDAVGLQLIHLLVDKVRDGFMEILQEVLDHLGDDMVRLLVLVLTLVRQIRFGITCRDERMSGIASTLITIEIISSDAFILIPFPDSHQCV